MIPQTPWIERTFNFDFPAGLYPCILERLRGTPARVKEMVAGLSEEVLIRKPNNKWSIKEHIGHLVDIEELHETRLQEFIESRATLSPADITNQKTNEAHHNDKTMEQLLTELIISRQHFIHQLEQASDDLVKRKSLHRRLKVPMRLVDMVYFIGEHDDHHLARARALSR
ncbi:MAG TPA: DinB family protein [Chitinophagales bacterium]|nr:DinB family protein [Chitinophagales bacterium]